MHSCLSEHLASADDGDSSHPIIIYRCTFLTDLFYFRITGSTTVLPYTWAGNYELAGGFARNRRQAVGLTTYRAIWEVGPWTGSFTHLKFLNSHDMHMGR